MEDKHLKTLQTGETAVEVPVDEEGLVVIADIGISVMRASKVILGSVSTALNVVLMIIGQTPVLQIIVLRMGTTGALQLVVIRETSRGCT